MVSREGCDSESLAETGVEVGLHLELPPQVTRPWGPRGFERRVARWALEGQLDRFEELFGRPPAYVDGHHHCHACSAEVAAAVARVARERGVAVRSVAPRHRELLRLAGVATPDLVVGRTDPAEALVPPELRHAIEEEGELPSGVVEWMVHPGYADPGAGSSYDEAREEDLRLLLDLAGEPRLRAARATHGEALGAVRRV
jgi:predicted glycoside hydrolase/deacetylase ChbG (UPF0249 family)